MRTTNLIIVIALSLMAATIQAKTVSVSSSGSSVIEEMSPRNQTYEINIALPSDYEADNDVVKDLFEGSFQALIEFVSKNSYYGSEIQSIQKVKDVTEGAKGLIRVMEAVEPRPTLAISDFHQKIEIQISDAMRHDLLKMERFKDEAGQAIRSFLTNKRSIVFWKEGVTLPATNIPQYTLLSKNKPVIYKRSSELPPELAQTYQETYQRLAGKLMSDVKAKCRSIIADGNCTSESADIEIEDDLHFEENEYLIEMKITATYSSDN